MNVISAQDLEPVSRKMKTYATAWVHPTRKLSSRVDKDGHVNPTWNDKFVFRVDEDFLHQDTSAVQIEIYCVNWIRDTLVGGVRVLLGNLFPPHTREMGTRFVALQVRRPSGRPQGILNIGVALLDSSTRSMPLYRQLSASARDLMSKEDHPPLHHNNINDPDHNNNKKNQTSILKPILWRNKSERSDRFTFDKNSAIGSSMVGMQFMNGGLDKEGSILSISYDPPPLIEPKKKGKASSVISGAELRDRPKKGNNFVKGSSVVSDSAVSKESSMYMKRHEIKSKKNSPNEKKEVENGVPTAKNIVDERTVTVSKGVGVGCAAKKPPTMAIGKLQYEGPKLNKTFVYGPKGSSLWSDSEVGPSPSEVAALLAERKYPLQEDRSSVLDGWSLDGSTEGLRSKLERWRTELPPIYDRGYSSSSFPSTSHHRRRHSDGGSSGMFSCFGNICGYECQCVCGKPPGQKSHSARYDSPSLGSRSFF